MEDPEQRWLKITSSLFPPPKEHRSHPNSLQKPSQKNRGASAHPTSKPQRPHPKNATKLTAVPIPIDATTTTDDLLLNNPTHHHLLNKLHQLSLSLEEKSQIISHQRNIIKTLQRRLTQSVKLKSAPTDKEQQHHATNNVPTLPNRSGGLTLPANTTHSKTHATATNIHQVLASVEALESRMSKMVASLPTKISQLCFQHLSKWEEEKEEECGGGDGKCFGIPEGTATRGCRPAQNLQCQVRDKSIWKPESEFGRTGCRDSMKIKSRKNQGKNQLVVGTRQRHVPPPAVHVDADVGGRRTTVDSCDVDDVLIRLEGVVNELKVGFIELVLERLRGRRREEKDVG